MASSASRPCANDFGRTSVGRSGLRFHEATRRGSAIAARVASPGWFARARSSQGACVSHGVRFRGPHARGARPPRPARDRVRTGPLFRRRTPPHATRRFFHTANLQTDRFECRVFRSPLSPSTRAFALAVRAVATPGGRRAVRQARRPGRARRARGGAQRLHLGAVLDRHPRRARRGSRDDATRCGTTTTAGRSPSRTRTTTACARSQPARFGVPHPAPVRGVLRLRRHLLRARSPAVTDAEYETQRKKAASG